jgi:hypothetical protein
MTGGWSTAIPNGDRARPYNALEAAGGPGRAQMSSAHRYRSATTGDAGDRDAFEPRAKAFGMTWEQWQEMLATRTHPRRLMTLEEIANVAVFIASHKASGVTGTTVNLTMGSLDD